MTFQRFNKDEAAKYYPLSPFAPSDGANPGEIVTVVGIRSPMMYEVSRGPNKSFVCHDIDLVKIGQ